MRNKNGEHAGKRNDKTLAKQSDKTSGKTKLQNRRENKMTEQNIIYDFLPKKNVLSTFARHSQSNVRKSNSIRGLSSIEFGNRTKSNTRLSVSSISEQIEFNRKNRTQSNSIQLIVFDWVRKPNSIEHN